jgi:hypothetical protein
MERSSSSRDGELAHLRKGKGAHQSIKDARPAENGELLFHRPKYLAFRSVKAFHFSGRSSSAKIADTGQTGTQAPQSMHSTGSMYNISSSGNAGASFLGWIQSTGQASTQAVSLVPMHGSAITYVIKSVSPLRWLRNLTEPLILARMRPAVQRSAGFSTHPLTLAPRLARTRRCDPPPH